MKRPYVSIYVDYYHWALIFSRPRSREDVERFVKTRRQWRILERDIAGIMKNYYSAGYVNRFLEMHDGESYTLRGFLELFRDYLASSRKRKTLLARYGEMAEAVEEYAERCCRRGVGPLSRYGFKVDLLDMYDRRTAARLELVTKTIEENCRTIKVVDEYRGYEYAGLYECQRNRVLVLYWGFTGRTVMAVWRKDMTVTRLAAALMEYRARECRDTCTHLEDVLDFLDEAVEEYSGIKTVIEMLS